MVDPERGTVNDEQPECDVPSAIDSRDVLHFFEGEPDYPFKEEDLIEKIKIGSGSFGTVVKAKHKQTGKQMAVKTIRLSDSNPLQRRNINREIYALTHSNGCASVVSFYGTTFSDGCCLLCMELMEASLAQLSNEMMRQNTRYSESFLWLMAFEIVFALSFLRTRLGMMHRDVKPENILVMRTGCIKLCDFGLACKLYNSIAKTKSRDVGTKKYMAPERITDIEGKYGAASDVFSLGLVFYEVVTCTFPKSFVTYSREFDSLNTIVNCVTPQQSQDDAPSYSKELRDFVNECLVKNPDVRPKFADLQKHPFHHKYSAEAMPSIRELVGEEITKLLLTMPAASDEDQKA